jgi:hypothetical protein
MPLMFFKNHFENREEKKKRNRIHKKFRKNNKKMLRRGGSPADHRTGAAPVIFFLPSPATWF